MMFSTLFVIGLLALTDQFALEVHTATAGDLKTTHHTVTAGLTLLIFSTNPAACETAIVSGERRISVRLERQKRI